MALPAAGPLGEAVEVGKGAAGPVIATGDAHIIATGEVHIIGIGEALPTAIGEVHITPGTANPPCMLLPMGDPPKMFHVEPSGATAAQTPAWPGVLHTA